MQRNSLDETKEDKFCYLILEGYDDRGEVAGKIHPNRNFIDIRKAINPLEMYLKWIAKPPQFSTTYIRSVTTEYYANDNDLPLGLKLNSRDNYIGLKLRYAAKFNVSSSKLEKLLALMKPVYEKFSNQKFFNAKETNINKSKAIAKLRNACESLNFEIYDNNNDHWVVYKNLYTNLILKNPCTIL